jgi:D-alanine transaminase
MTARAANLARAEALARTGIAVITLPEQRWARVDIKSTNLLPNVLAKEAARRAGAAEAWFVDAEGFVTEGASTNAWIVMDEARLVTRKPSGILKGITRGVLFEHCGEAGLSIEERAFTVEEAQSAREAFITAATTLIMPVVRIDGRPVGTGKPGPIAARLRAAYHGFAELSAADGGKFGA